MVEFSKEYFDREKLPFDGDFFYLELFKDLKEGEVNNSLCEGLGLLGITKIDNQPYLIIDNSGNVVEYFTYINNL